MPLSPLGILSRYILLYTINAAFGTSPYFRRMLDLYPEEKVDFVDAHNYFRRQVTDPQAANMKLMSWDDDLAKLAESVVKTCSFFHTSQRDRTTKDFRIVGENLYTGGDYRFSQMMKRDGVTKLWYDEIQFHNMTSLTCQPKKECGHYKQVIWADTYKLGCAIAKCSQVEGGHPPYLVCCSYGPAGNRYRYSTPIRPYIPGAPCSKCNPGEVCVDKLCNATGIVPSTTEATSLAVTTTSPVTTSITTSSTTRTTIPVTTSITTSPTTRTTIPVTTSITTFSTTRKTTPVVTTYTTSSTGTEVIVTSLPATATTFTNLTMTTGVNVTGTTASGKKASGSTACLLIAITLWAMMTS